MIISLYGQSLSIIVINVSFWNQIFTLFQINVCIPGPDYTFSNPNLMIGGYGRNRRVPCEVNDLGPSIFQVSIYELLIQNLAKLSLKLKMLSLKCIYKSIVLKLLKIWMFWLKIGSKSGPLFYCNLYDSKNKTMNKKFLKVLKKLKI